MLLKDFYALSHINVSALLTLFANLAVSGADDRIAMRLLVQHNTVPAEEKWIHFSQEALAGHVALSPQSVRRSLRALESRGLIETAYGRIRVIDYDGLAELCGYTAPSRRKGS